MDSLIDNLGRKPFVLKNTSPHFGKNGEKIKQINVLGIGIEDEEILSGKLFGTCVKTKDISDEGGVDRSLWRCNNVALLNLTKNCFNYENALGKNTELNDMINTGKIPWGDSVKPASLIGYYLGQHYWYWNEPSYSNQPHVIFKSQNSQPIRFNLPNQTAIYPATSNGVVDATKMLKESFIVNHVSWLADSSYENGYQSGKEKSKKSREEGFESGLVFAALFAEDNSKTIDECQKSLKTCRETNAQAYQNGFREAERSYKK